MNGQTRILMRVLVAGYVLYLGWDIAKTQYTLGSAMSDGLAYGSAAVLMLAGAAVIVHTLAGYLRSRRDGKPGEKEEADHA